MSSRWYTSQTINDDLVLLLYDDYFVFVIILRAKASSLVTNDEPAHFVIECSHSVTKLVIVTSESSLMNTFLVVIYRTECLVSMGLHYKMEVMEDISPKFIEYSNCSLNIKCTTNIR